MNVCRDVFRTKGTVVWELLTERKYELQSGEDTIEWSIDEHPRFRPPKDIVVRRCHQICLSFFWVANLIFLGSSAGILVRQLAEERELLSIYVTARYTPPHTSIRNVIHAWHLQVLVLPIFPTQLRFRAPFGEAIIRKFSRVKCTLVIGLDLSDTSSIFYLPAKWPIKKSRMIYLTDPIGLVVYRSTTRYSSGSSPGISQAREHQLWRDLQRKRDNKSGLPTVRKVDHSVALARLSPSRCLSPSSACLLSLRSPYSLGSSIYSNLSGYSSFRLISRRYHQLLRGWFISSSHFLRVVFRFSVALSPLFASGLLAPSINYVLVVRRAVRFLKKKLPLFDPLWKRKVRSF